MSGLVQDALEAGREAMRRHDWEEARRLLSEADAARQLDAFPHSKSALDCAVSIQRNLADHRRQHGFAPRVRIGIHATSASHTGGRYRGRGVHEASRIAALAGPDEIVASRITVPPTFRVSEPREATVKGISKPLELVTVEWKI